MNIPIWTEENQRNIEKLQKDTGIFLNPFFGYTHEDEHPNTEEKDNI
jgi:hypothetical protein